MSRAERIEKGISGYQVEAYDFIQIENDLAKLLNNESINLSSYDHHLGQSSAIKRVIKPCDVLFIDGLHAMHKRLTPFIDFSVFIHTTDEQLKNIRLCADREKRNQSVEVSLKNSAVEFEKYKRLVAPYKKAANCTLLLKSKWKYVLA